jgi:hypothetical protein
MKKALRNSSGGVGLRRQPTPTMNSIDTIKIKALWTNYGPRFHHAGKNTDCVSDTDSWAIAAYDLDRWIERNHPGKTPVFCGPSAASAKQGWEEFGL